MLSVPYLFINVTLQLTSQCISYAGGRTVVKVTNSETAYVREASHPKEQHAELYHKIEKGWKNAISSDSGKEK
jgi:hypothetical protein